MVVVYTAVTGKYDNIRKLEVVEEGFNYLCFTNYEFEGDVPLPWLHVRLPPSSLSNKDLARFCKLNPHLLLPQYNKSLWIDGNITIKSCISEFTHSVLSNHDVASYDHWWRDSTEQEFFACSIGGFDFSWKLKKQWERYKSEGYVAKQFFENNVIFRNHMKAEVMNMHKLWWEEYLRGGKRDQYSFTYSAYKNNVNIFSLGVHDPRITKCFFDYFRHNSGRGKIQFIRKIINRIYIYCSGWTVEKPKRKNLLK